MGQIAAKTLLRLINGESIEGQKQSIHVMPTLIKRRSTTAVSRRLFLDRSHAQFRHRNQTSTGYISIHIINHKDEIGVDLSMVDAPD